MSSNTATTATPLSKPRFIVLLLSFAARDRLDRHHLPPPPPPPLPPPPKPPNPPPPNPPPPKPPPKPPPRPPPKPPQKGPIIMPRRRGPPKPPPPSRDRTITRITKKMIAAGPIGGIRRDVSS